MNDSWTPLALTYDPIKVGSIDGTDTEPHDHGIVRACYSNYHPNKGIIGDPECSVFVGRLSPSVDETKLIQLFSKYGKVRRCRVVRDFVTGFSKNYAFIEFYEKSDARVTCRKLNGRDIDSNYVIVLPECERTLENWIPRRLGGGFGGKKESGQLRFGGVERPFRPPIHVPEKLRKKTNNGNDDSSCHDHGHLDRNSDAKTFSSYVTNIPFTNSIITSAPSSRDASRSKDFRRGRSKESRISKSKDYSRKYRSNFDRSRSNSPSSRELLRRSKHRRRRRSKDLERSTSEDNERNKSKDSNRSKSKDHIRSRSKEYDISGLKDHKRIKSKEPQTRKNHSNEKKRRLKESKRIIFDDSKDCTSRIFKSNSRSISRSKEYKKVRQKDYKRIKNEDYDLKRELSTERKDIIITETKFIRITNKMEY